MVLLPEYALALIADDLEQADVVFPPERLLIVADHFAPPATIERARILHKVQALCESRKWPLRLFEGICHQLLVEDPRVLPGTLVVGSDSHTVTAGGIGCLAIGFGSTDILGVLTTGKIALRTPETVRIVFTGRLPEGVMGKDIILEILRRFGPQRLSHAALECVDYTSEGISQSGRFAICNMIIEAGGKAALFLPDAITKQYLSNRDGEECAALDGLPPTAVSGDTHEVNITDLEPLVAAPHNPFNVHPLSDSAGLPLDQVFLGSCSAGRLEDLAIAARILTGRRTKPGLKAIVIPGSRQVYLEALDAGYIKTLVEAGVTLCAPSCGPCGAIDKGVLAPGECCAATINRNYKGRMGSPDADIYLVNSAVSAASMVTGKLTDAREFL